MVQTSIYVTCTKCGRTYECPDNGYHYNCPYCYDKHEAYSDGYWRLL